MDGWFPGGAPYHVYRAHRHPWWMRKLDRRLRAVPIVVWATVYAAMFIRAAAHWAQ